jgi:hypothetical protein
MSITVFAKIFVTFRKLFSRKAKINFRESFAKIQKTENFRFNLKSNQQKAEQFINSISGSSV